LAFTPIRPNLWLPQPLRNVETPGAEFILRLEFLHL
jgi:hypothetical protein